MKKFWSQRIQSVTPYTPGEQPRGDTFIKLNTNENPYPPSPDVIEAVRKAAGDSLRLYPDPECLSLRRAVAERFGLAGEAEVFAGNGSDEILAFCFQAFFDTDKPIVFADITYSFYPVYAEYFGIPYRAAVLDGDFNIPVEAYFGSEGGVVLANPNAPTGKAVALGDIRRILDENPGVVVIVDEAYVDFGGNSSAGLIRSYPNLVVVQTLSKSASLAGLRVGYAMGHPNLMDALRCVRDSINSYTVDRLAQAGAEAAVRDTAWLARNTAKIAATREKTAARLREMGFLVHDSAANFLFIRHNRASARNLLGALREAGILVRRFDRPRIDDYLRVSIGTDDEMDALCAALTRLLS